MPPAKNCAFDGSIGRHQQSLQLLISLYGFTCAALPVSAPVLYVMLQHLLFFSAHPSSGPPSDRIPVTLTIPPNTAQDERSCHPVHAGSFAFWLCQLNWDKLLSARPSYMGIEGTCPGDFLIPIPVNMGGLTDEDWGISPDFCFWMLCLFHSPSLLTSKAAPQHICIYAYF